MLRLRIHISERLQLHHIFQVITVFHFCLYCGFLISLHAVSKFYH